MDTVGKIPEFTTDGQPSTEEVKETAPETTTEQVPETDTPAPPAEKPAETNGVGTPEPSQEYERAIKGLQNERVNLLKEISELKGQKRELKQEQIDKVQAQIDELKDLHPEDVATIDRVLRAKGFITKGEADKMFYEAVKNEELEKFLSKYPEYKPENDPGDTNWGMLQRELGYYRMPDNPRLLTEVLERAHRSIVKVPSGSPIQARKRQVEIASVGGGGTQRQSPSPVALDSTKREILRRGGWSEEEIQSIEKRVT